MSVQISQIRCFVAVATELHFGRAAALLNMTQPPLTRQIQMLEQALGVSLLERNRRFVRLTASGQAYLVEAQDILRRLTSAELAARRAVVGEQGTVVMGFIPAASYGFLPRLITLAKQQMPHVDLVLKEMQSIDQLEALSSDKIDLGIIRPISQRPGVASACVLTELFVLAVPTSHPLADRETAQLSDLDGEPFIMYSPSEGRYSYEMLVGPFRAAACAPRYVQYISYPHTILSLVSAGLGLGLVPVSAARLHFDNVCFKDIELGGARAELHLAWRASGDKPAVNALREGLIQALVSVP
jgi:DNA-binding transcriptional LysR family regulator